MSRCVATDNMLLRDKWVCVGGGADGLSTNASVCILGLWLSFLGSKETTPYVHGAKDLILVAEEAQ